MKTICRLAIAVGVLTAWPVFAQAPARLDARWTPWLGCWRLVQESVREASPSSSIDPFTESGATQPATSRPGTGEILVCVQPTDAGVGVKMTTFAGGRSVLEQTIMSDGISHPVNEADCRGTQTNEWSRDGERLFTRGELACKGQPTRTVSGVTVLARGPGASSAAAALRSPAWLDIQAVELNGDQQVRVRRYQRTVNKPAEAAELPADVSARAVAAARAVSATPISLDDVVEASSKIGSQAVEAALVETASRFDLDSRALIRLADAEVERNVIDLMVALSFPEHFKVERRAAPAIMSGSGPLGMFGASYGPYYPYGGYDPYGIYDPYAYSSYYYSPFAYSYWGNSYYYVPGSASSAIFVPGTTPGETSGSHGRVIQGRGYTQVTPNSASESAGSGATSSNSGRTSVGSSGSSSSSSDSGSGSSSGGGGVSSGGYSSGGSGSDSGRTAQPR